MQKRTKIPNRNQPPSLAIRVVVGLVSLYQFVVSPLLGANCRHLPTCSQYAKEALQAHGLLRGSCYAVKRILRCHPGVEPSFDPVPQMSRTICPPKMICPSETMRPSKNVKG